MLLKDILNKLKKTEIKRIENENGTAIKYNDGTMLQYGIYDTESIGITTQYGAGFYDGKTHQINFPVTFTRVDNISVSGMLEGNIGGATIGPLTQINNSSFKAFIFAIRSYEGTKNIKIHWQAIGRWK